MRHAGLLLHHLREAVGRVAWAIARPRWASELIASARIERRFIRLRSKHLAAGGVVVTREARGFKAVSLEG